MKVELFYLEGCPNVRPTRDRLRHVLNGCGLLVPIMEIQVDDEEATKLQFLGSPTIRIDGVDIEPPSSSKGRLRNHVPHVSGQWSPIRGPHSYCHRGSRSEWSSVTLKSEWAIPLLLPVTISSAEANDSNISRWFGTASEALVSIIAGLVAGSVLWSDSDWILSKPILRSGSQLT